MIMKIQIPETVQYIINRIEYSGYRAYAVGGCIRDSLLGKAPDDWDVCTSALPNEIIEVFADKKIIETGIKHGTVTLLLDSSQFEITTFRTDGKYSDNRRPESVSFVRNIEDDLSRRDFTVNAMAYNPSDGLIDLFGGQQDLNSRIIRCVGNPDTRFSEDALRILRAIRFSAVLNFKIDEKTKSSIFKNKKLLNNIAKERINTEFTKTLMSDSKTVFYEYGKVFSVFFKNADTFSESLDCLPKNKAIRLARLILSVCKNISEAESILTELRYDKKTVSAVLDICSHFDIICSNITEMRLLLSKIKYDTLFGIFTIKQNTNCLNMLNYIKENKLCSSVRELEINGSDLINIGISNGTDVGRALNELLRLVIYNKLENKKSLLIKKAKELYL